MTAFVPPESLRPLLARIDEAARVAGVRAFAVGGTVRDTLLGRQLRDLDIAADRAAIDFGRQLGDVLGGHFVMLDSDHAVARIVLDEGAVGYVDVAQLQGALDDDLRRRDFTAHGRRRHRCHRRLAGHRRAAAQYHFGPRTRR
jgi:poly(A) polymerase